MKGSKCNRMVLLQYNNMMRLRNGLGIASVPCPLLRKNLTRCLSYKLLSFFLIVALIQQSLSYSASSFRYQCLRINLCSLVSSNPFGRAKYLIHGHILSVTSDPEEPLV